MFFTTSSQGTADVEPAELLCMKISFNDIVAGSFKQNSQKYASPWLIGNGRPAISLGSIERGI
jgi:hypothetical protein